MTITLAPNAVYRLLRVSLKVCSSSKSEHFFLSVLSGRFFIFLAIVSFIFYSQFTFFCSFYSALVIECVCVGWPNHSRNSNRIELMFNRLMQDAQSVMSNCYCILFLGSTSYMRNLRLFRRCFYHFFFFFLDLRWIENIMVIHWMWAQQCQWNSFRFVWRSSRTQNFTEVEVNTSNAMAIISK